MIDFQDKRLELQVYEAIFRIEKFNGATLLLTYKVTNAVGDICAEGSSKHCFTDKNMRPVRIKRTFPDIYETFASHLEPAEK